MMGGVALITGAGRGIGAATALVLAKHGYRVVVNHRAGVPDLSRLTRDEAHRYYERCIGAYFSSDGRVDHNVARQAVGAVAKELGVAAASVDQVYQSAL